jgi:prepilin-type N-terminal cleavage/methylation domain-containing protein
MTAPSPSAVHPDRSRAFSLVELLVAVSVFALLLVLLIQILGGVLQATNFSQRQLEARENIQAVLGSFEQDCGSAVTQFGVPIYVTREADGNARFAFLTRNRGSSATTNSRFLAVDYQRKEDGRMVRVSGPLIWSELGVAQAAVQPGTGTNVSELAENIIRFEALAELGDGTLVDLDSGEAGSGVFADGTPIPGNFRGVTFPATGTNAVKSIIVSVAALDRRSMEILESAGSLSQLVAALGTGTGRTPLERWSSALRSGSLDALPLPVRETIQFAERTYSPK